MNCCHILYSYRRPQMCARQSPSLGPLAPHCLRRSEPARSISDHTTALSRSGVRVDDNGNGSFPPALVIRWQICDSLYFCRVYKVEFFHLTMCFVGIMLALASLLLFTASALLASPTSAPTSFILIGDSTTANTYDTLRMLPSCMQLIRMSALYWTAVDGGMAFVVPQTRQSQCVGRSRWVRHALTWLKTEPLPVASWQVASLTRPVRPHKLLFSL
jgi:hypothetical protein